MSKPMKGSKRQARLQVAIQVCDVDWKLRAVFGVGTGFLIFGGAGCPVFLCVLIATVGVALVRELILKPMLTLEELTPPPQPKSATGASKTDVLAQIQEVPPLKEDDDEDEAA